MIDIIMCTYNGEKYLVPQIDTILMQPGPDYKLTVYDDASCDGTAQMLMKYKKYYPDSFDYHIRDTSSGGACKNFLMAMRAEAERNYDYYMLADQDDVWTQGKLKTMYHAMKYAEDRYGKDMPLLIYSDASLVDDQMQIIANSYIRYQKLNPNRKQYNHLLVQNQVTGGAVIYNRSLAKKLDILEDFIPEHAIMHDHWLALIASLFGHIMYLDKPLYAYRQHGDNALGAEKGGLAVEVLKRAGLSKAGDLKQINEQSKKSYAALYAQAKDIKKYYYNDMTQIQKEVTDAFIDMQHSDRLTKIRTISKYDLSFDHIHRTIGECLFI